MWKKKTQSELRRLFFYSLTLHAPKGLGRYKLGNLKTAAKAASQEGTQQEAHVGEVQEHLDIHSHGSQLQEGGPCPS